MTTELFDMEIDKVGLVKRGANGLRWFLMKGDNMDAEKDLQTLDGLMVDVENEEGVTTRSWNTLVGLIKSAFSAKEPEEVLEVPVEDDSVIEARFEAIEKSHQEALAKADNESRERIEKAEARVAVLEKAAELKNMELLVKSSGVDAEHLYTIKHTSPEAFDAISERFTALEKQVSETGLWNEIGSSQPPNPDQGKVLETMITELAKSDSISTDAAFNTIGSNPEFKEIYDRYVADVGHGDI